MTVLLVLFTLILFLIADGVVQKVRRAKSAPLARPLSINGFRLPDNLALALNHTWVKNDSRGIATIGLDELLGKVVGSVEDILLPPLNALVGQSDDAFVLRHGTKTLPVASPVEGRVVAVNANLVTNPALARKDPYGTGWLVKVVPRSQSSSFPERRTGKEALEWLKHQAELMREFFAAQNPHPSLATMQDGGVPSEGLLLKFDRRVWGEFQRSFASLPSQTNQRP
jgi:glycine cleavage system H protein